MGHLRIAQVASEAAPLAKTGGLADVVGTLSRQLDSCGHKVTIFLPFYRETSLFLKTAPQLVRKVLPVHLHADETQ